MEIHPLGLPFYHQETHQTNLDKRKSNTKKLLYHKKETKTKEKKKVKKKKNKNTSTINVFSIPKNPKQKTRKIVFLNTTNAIEINQIKKKDKNTKLKQKQNTPPYQNKPNNIFLILCNNMKTNPSPKLKDTTKTLTLIQQNIYKNHFYINTINLKIKYQTLQNYFPHT
jgi:hypothetical protein